MNDEIKQLQEKIAYLERHVAEQDKAMLEMAEDIDRLRRELRAFRERGPSSSTDAGQSIPDERPPHY